MPKINRFFLMAALLVGIVGLSWIFFDDSAGLQKTKNGRVGSSLTSQSNSSRARRSIEPASTTHQTITATSVSTGGAPVSFAEIKQKAERGDSVAQREISAIYEECSGYSLNPTTYLKTLDALSQLSPGSAKSMEKIKKRQTALCATVDHGAPIPREAYELWLEQAARGGDLTAKIKLKARSADNIPAKELAALAEKAIDSKDPSALFELAALMGRPSSSDVTGPLATLAGSSYREYAWGIVACRMGAPCGEGSALMTSLCINTGRCNYTSYEAFTMTEVGAGGREKIKSAIDDISRFISH